MKAKQFTTMSLALLMAVGLMTTGWAGSPESANIFKNPGSKQTAEDFKPAPAKMQTNFGTLEFEGGAFPNKASVQKIYDELDLQRATQAYMDFFPALSLYAIVKSQVRDFPATHTCTWCLGGKAIPISCRWLRTQKSFPTRWKKCGCC